MRSFFTAPMLLAALASARTFTIDVTGDQVNLQGQDEHATKNCQWFGTSPFCNGECPKGWGWCFKSGTGDGKKCFTGWKWYCCEGKGNGCPGRDIAGDGADTRGDEPHDEYCDKGYIMVCPPGAAKNEDCRCIEDPGDGHHRKVDEEL